MWGCFFFFSLFLLKHPAQYGKLYEHGDAHDYDWCHQAVYAYLHAEPEEHYVQSEVHGMRPREPHEVLPRRLLAESEATRGVVVYEKTNDVAYGIRRVYLYHQLQQIIDYVVNGSREAPVEDKTHKLRLTLITVFQCLRLIF